MRRKNLKGFTIVEVSLVLAIAGLILLMVFIALPTLQRQARDAQRRDDVLMFINKLKNYQASNNRGALPGNGGIANVNGNQAFSGNPTSGSWKYFYKNFFTDSFTDPSYDTPYTWIVRKCVDSGKSLSTGQKCNFKHYDKEINDYLNELSSVNNIMYILLSASCNGADAVYSANARNVAVLYKMESGGVFCANT